MSSLHATSTRTITAVDHRTTARLVESNADTSAGASTEITGGRRVAAVTAVAGLLVIALGLVPLVMAIAH